MKVIHPYVNPQMLPPRKDPILFEDLKGSIKRAQ